MLFHEKCQFATNSNILYIAAVEENKTIKVFKDGRFVKQIEVPNGDYKKIPLNQYIDLITEWKKSEEFYEEYGSETKKRAINTQKMILIMEQVAAYYDCPELLDGEIELNGIREKANFKNLSSIYGSLWSQPKKLKLLPEFNFDYKGRHFKFKTVTRDRIRHTNIFEGLNVCEAIHILDVLRLKNLQIENDVTGSILYSSYISLVAILAREEGQILPIDRQRRLRYIEDMRFFFREVPAYIPLYFDFWIKSWYNHLERKPHLFYFFNSPKIETPKTQEGKERMAKEIKRNKEIMRQIGYRNIIYRLLDLGAFNNNKQTPLEAALSADFETAIELISEDNRLK